MQNSAQMGRWNGLHVHSYYKALYSWLLVKLSGFGKCAWSTPHNAVQCGTSLYKIMYEKGLCMQPCSQARFSSVYTNWSDVVYYLFDTYIWKKNTLVLIYIPCRRIASLSDPLRFPSQLVVRARTVKVYTSPSCGIVCMKHVKLRSVTIWTLPFLHRSPGPEMLTK